MPLDNGFLILNRSEENLHLTCLKPSAEKRRKNDRRDAAFLARLLATRNITEVWVPPVVFDSLLIAQKSRAAFHS